jgi:hypothetical protein
VRHVLVHLHHILQTEAAEHLSKLQCSSAFCLQEFQQALSSAINRIERELELLFFAHHSPLLLCAFKACVRSRQSKFFQLLCNRCLHRLWIL